MDIDERPERRMRIRLTVGAGVILVLAAAAIAVIVSAVTPHGVSATASRPVAVHTSTPAPGSGPTEFVHVVGEVKNPGLYELAAGSRVVDAVARAGGFAADADQSQLNLARVVADGEQISVAKVGAAPQVAGSSPSGKVDLNTADATALETLDGIGPALAQRILAFRQAHGGFSSINQLQSVGGIGDKKFAAIKDNVTT